MSKTGNQTNVQAQAPVHVLMGQSSQKRHIDYVVQLPDDFIVKRQRVLYDAKSANAQRTSLWDGVKKSEMDMVACCEEPRGDDVDLSEFGALDATKECRFLGIMSRCDTVASRSLALAILERTLETYFYEKEEEAAKTANSSSSSNSGSSGSDSADTDSKASPTKTENAKKAAASNAKSSTASTDTNRDENDNGASGEDTKSKTSTPQNENGKSTGEDVKAQDEPQNNAGVPKKPEIPPKRLEAFLGGGGLSILNHWLQEVVDPPITTAKRKPQMRGKAKESSKPSPPSPMRALLLPLLRLLQFFPVEKNAVIDSKINRQIKKLSKKVAAEVAARKSQSSSKKATSGAASIVPFLPPGAASGGVATELTEIQTATDNIMKVWQEAVKNRTDPVPDPFANLKKKLNANLDILVNYEQDDGPKPQWLIKLESKAGAGVANGGSSKDNGSGGSNKKKKKETKNATKLAIMAANERQKERENLRKRLKAAEEERRQSVIKLREQIRKRKQEAQQQQQAQEEAELLRKRNKGGKVVQWKDGLKTTHNRNKELLEQVFVFNKEYIARPPEQASEEAETTTVESPKSQLKQAIKPEQHAQQPMTESEQQQQQQHQPSTKSEQTTSTPAKANDKREEATGQPAAVATSMEVDEPVNVNQPEAIPTKTDAVEAVAVGNANATAPTSEDQDYSSDDSDLFD